MNPNQFLYLAHCENGRPSSKRLYGGIGWIVVQICLIIACILSFVHCNGLNEIVKDLLYFDLSISATLLGLSTITGIFGNGKQVSISNPPESPQK